MPSDSPPNKNTTLHLPDLLGRLGPESPAVALESLSLGGVARLALLQAPGSRVVWPPLIPGVEARLEFYLGMKPTAEGACTFRVLAGDGARMEEIFRRSAGPAEAGGWAPVSVALGRFAGMPLRLAFEVETGDGPGIPAWGDPVVWHAVAAEPGLESGLTPAASGSGLWFAEDTLRRDARQEAKRLEGEVKLLAGLLERLKKAAPQLQAGRGWPLKHLFQRGTEARAAEIDRILTEFGQWQQAGLRREEEMNHYARWLQTWRPSPEALQETVRGWDGRDDAPLLGIVMDLAGVAPSSKLKQAVASVLGQAWSRWRLLVMGGDAAVRAMLPEDPRIVLLDAGEDALRPGIGWFTSLGAEDWIEPQALAEVAPALIGVTDSGPPDLVFTDEDEIGEKDRLGNPFCKPEWSPDTLEGMNCVGALAVWRWDFLEGLGAGLAALHPSRAYDLVLRASEAVGFHAVRVPGLLYHRRHSSHAVAQGLKAGDLTALNAALARRGEDAEAAALDSGVFRVRRSIPRRERVAILIPTRDRLELLRRSVESLQLKTLYDNYEIVIINNESRDPFTVDWLARCGHRVFDYKGPFNYAAMHNEAVKTVDAPWLCFLNNDTEIIDGGWLAAMAEHVQRPEIAAVGAKLLFPDNTVQHAGIVLGIQRKAAHAFAHLAEDDARARRQLHTVRNYSAVTAACMMMRRAVYEELEGFDEKRFPIAYNDIDLCLRALRKGYRNLVTPHAVVKHHECASRPRHDIPEEVHKFQEAWISPDPAWTDPCYHPLLNPFLADFTLRRP